MVSVKQNPNDFTWSQNAHGYALLYKGRVVGRVTKNNSKSYGAEVDGKYRNFPTLSMAKQKTLQLARKTSAVGNLKGEIKTDQEMLDVVNQHGNRAIIAKHGKAVKVKGVAFMPNTFRITFADGYEIESKIPKMRNPVKNHAENNTIEPVIFRKFNGEVIAFFPYLTGDSSPYTMTSYSHNGQHSAASEDFYRDTKKTLSSEYLPLKRELHSLGYKLKVIDRMPSNAMQVRRAELQRLRSNPKNKVANGGQLDEQAAHELYLYTVNDSQLMRSQGEPIYKNLITKKARGVYQTELAIKLAMYLMDNAAKKYAREFGGTWNDMFNVPTRREAAKEFIRYYEEEADLGNYDDYLPKKYQKNPQSVKSNDNDRKRIIEFLHANYGLSLAILEKKTFTQLKQDLNRRIKLVRGVAKNATATDFKKHQTNRLRELSQMFQGEANGDKHRVIESDYAPKNKYRLGYLVQIKIKDGGRVIPINFNGETAILAGDLKNNLWAVGEGSILGNVRKAAKGQLRYLGEVTQVDYVTAKKHIEGGKTVRFYHKLGEVTGEKPNLFIDSDGFPVFVGGGYDIWNVGIVN